MRLLHISDLHLGKRFKEFSLLEDQEHILEQILILTDKTAPDGILIAGDIYDKSVPSAEAVALFDRFLTRLAARRIPVFAISGNHDSAERIAFGSSLMTQSGIHLSPVYTGSVEPISLEDNYGKVNIYLLPFLRPQTVRRAFPEEAEQIADYSGALACAVSHMTLDPKQRNILVTHQFVTGSSGSGSEESFVGGTESVDVQVFDGFDYVALGHIHAAQSVSRETVRYCGTPMKYDFSEIGQEKSVTLVELGQKGTISVTALPLTPLRDMRQIRGSYDELMTKSTYEGTDTQDFIRAVLTDEQDVPDAMRRMRNVYPNLAELLYDNRRTRQSSSFQALEAMEALSPAQLFAQFYESQNGSPLLDVQREFLEAELAKLTQEVE